MKRVLSDVLESALNIFLVIMLFINFFNIVERNIYNMPMPKLFGIGYAIVISGSMEPEISVNDVVYIKEQKSYEVGDVITFADFAPGQYERTKDTPLVTHRIFAITDNGQYITKGDANNTRDQVPIPIDRIEGKVFATLPVVGASVAYMKQPIGTLWMMLLALLLIELPYLVRTSHRTASEKEVAAFVAKLRPATAGVTVTPDNVVEEDPNQLLLSGIKPTKRKERAPYVPPKEEKRRLFSRKPKVYVPEEGRWNID